MAVPLTVSSVPAQTPYAQYVATSGQTVFPYPFEITQDADLICLVAGVELGTDVGYTLSGQGAPTGGYLTFAVGQTAGTVVTLYRDITIARVTQLANNGTFFASNFNNEFNRIYLIMQQLQESGNFALSIPNTNNPAPVTTLTPGLYANKYLSFDANGNPQPAVLTSVGTLTPSIVGGLLYPQTTVEYGLGVVPTSYLYPTGNVMRYGATGLGSVDDTVAIQTAINVAVAGDITVIVPYGTYLINGGTFTATTGSLKMYGIGRPVFLCSSVASKSSTSDGFSAATIFDLNGKLGGATYYPPTSVSPAPTSAVLSIKNIAFHNTDTSGTATRVFFANAVAAYMEIEDNSFIGWSVAGYFGQLATAAGVNPDSNSLTAVGRSSFRRNYVYSDSQNTAGTPKSFHIWCHVGATIDGNEIYGLGSGDNYNLRVAGGSYDCVPQPGVGSANIRITNNHFWTANGVSEWNQVIKTTGIVIANNTFDASTGTSPQQFFDCFNCFSLSFTGNAGVGGGLCFFGHADLNNSAYPSTLVGAHGFTGSGNTILNPSTDTGIFNFGGDGNESGNRASHKYTIVGNTVTTTPGFTANAACSFINAFLGNDYVVSANNVENIPTFLSMFFCLNFNITHNILNNVPACVVSTGNDGAHQHFGNQYLGTAGTTNTFETGLPNATVFSTNVGLNVSSDLQTFGSNFFAKNASAFGTGGSTSIVLPYSAAVPCYKVFAAFSDGSLSGGQTGVEYIAVGSAAGIELTGTPPSGLTVAVVNSTGNGTVTATYSGSGAVVLSAQKVF